MLNRKFLSQGKLKSSFRTSKIFSPSVSRLQSNDDFKETQLQLSPNLTGVFKHWRLIDSQRLSTTFSSFMKNVQKSKFLINLTAKNFLRHGSNLKRSSTHPPYANFTLRYLNQPSEFNLQQSIYHLFFFFQTCFRESGCVLELESLLLLPLVRIIHFERACMSLHSYAGVAPAATLERLKLLSSHAQSTLRLYDSERMQRATSRKSVVTPTGRKRSRLPMLIFLCV